MDVGGSKGGLKADINVTPLVDVMLVLLIIMMLIAPDAAEGRRVTLPEAANTADKPDTQEQTVVADRRARTSSTSTASRSRRTTRRQASRRVLEDKTEKIVLIKGDTDAPYSAIMEAMDALRKARIEDIGLITERRSTPDGSGGRQVAWSTHTSIRRREGRHGRDPARQRGHERHAAHRRAARAAHHLHGGPAAHAEGRRHQPAARDEDAEQTQRRHDADRAGVQRRPVDRRQQAAGHLGELETRLRDIFETRKEKTMFIVGDPTLRYGEIVAVIDAAKGAGVEKVGIVTEGMRRGE